MKTSVSVIKADIGGCPGHSTCNQKLIDNAKKILKKSRVINDSYVTHCGDDLELIMTHKRGVDNKEIHKLAWNVFEGLTDKISKKEKYYGAGQDLLKNAFSGNVKGMGPGVAEMEFEERKSDPVLVFMADKTESGAWNLPLYKIFADPFNTAGLVIDPHMHDGFIFEVLDARTGKTVKLTSPEEIYDLLALIGSPSRYIIKAVYSKKKEIAAVTSTQKLSQMAGRYVGKDDPVMVCRAQSGFPAVGEVLEPFAFPFLVSGWMRGSHNGPFTPVSQGNARCTRFDGPPRVIGVGFQVTNRKIIGHQDLFDDPAFDLARQKSGETADYMRRHGPFQPHRLPDDEMEYTTMPAVMKKLRGKFK